jgi:hypothetical protein
LEQCEECPAKLCFSYDSVGHEQECFEAEIIIDKTSYKFQLVNNLSIISLSKGQNTENGILFIAEYFGGGSGTLSLISIWIYSIEEKKFVNILPKVTITEQGEYKILMANGDKEESIFVIADYILGKGETHFDPHRYKISIYQYNIKNSAFNLLAEYVTTSKYKSLNYSNKADIINYELDKIKKYIK